MAEKKEDPRTTLISMSLSKKEKQELDDICAYYNMSRADVLRVAMYMAKYEKVSFLYARDDAISMDYLSNFKRKRH